jgi:two-component system sensor histidine kinase RpfC
MKFIASLKSKFAARGDSEHEQAILRMVIVGLILGYMGVFENPRDGWHEHEIVLVTGLIAFFAVAVAIFLGICIWPAKNVLRRFVGMLSDTGGATFYMCLAGEYGVSMIAVYLFVTFGNGFRFGRKYLFACQALCILGLSGVLLFVPYWKNHQPAGIGLLIAMIVLPLYVSTLLKRIHEARARAEEANRAKSAFLANMSHEMRTPLNGLVGLVDLMNATPLSKQQTELMRLLRHSVSVLRSLVDDVLDISKIEAGRLTIELVSFDLHSSINGLAHLLRPHAKAKGLRFEVLVDPAVDYRVQGDPHHIRQVLLNLLGNAIKFTDRGEVTLTVSLAKETADAMTVRFEVRDTGIGMSGDALGRIFERFVQADQSTTRRFGGTGLGTTIAKQLVELMGGNIGVKSTLGEGSLFWFELPLLRDVPSVDQQSASNELGQVALVVADAPKASSIVALVRAAGKSAEAIPTGASVGQTISKLQASGVAVDAVIVAASVDVACSAFASASQRLSDCSVAFLHISSEPLSIVDKARIHSIKDARSIGPQVSSKMLRNAIHAAIAGSDGYDGDLADLATVLKQQRVRARILVAEDNETNQTIIRQLLEKAGHEVLLASDGEEALDLYEREAPDIAILDFNMPERTGCEVIQAIRHMESPGRRMPAIILSASVTLEARERAKSSGADDFVGKPFEAVALLEKIDQLTQLIKSGTRGTTPRNRRTPSQPAVMAQVQGRDPPGAENVDWKRVAELEDIARDTAFVTELLRGFIADSERLLSSITTSTENKDYQALSDLAHALKGAAVGIGAAKLTTLVRQFEIAAQEKCEDDIELLLPSLHECYSETLVDLRRYVLDRHHVAL